MSIFGDQNDCLYGTRIQRFQKERIMCRDDASEKYVYGDQEKYT